MLFAGPNSDMWARLLACSSRSGNTATVLEGIGGLLHVVSGNHVVFRWPFCSVLGKSATIGNCASFLFDDMGRVPIDSWADGHPQWTQLSSGDSLWACRRSGREVQPRGSTVVVWPLITHPVRQLRNCNAVWRLRRLLGAVRARMAPRAPVARRESAEPDEEPESAPPMGLDCEMGGCLV